MNQGLTLLFKENLASWFRAKGFVMILVAALVPAALTGVWVYAHQADIAVTGIEADPANPEIGDVVNITATLENRYPRDAPPFDVTIRIGFYRQVGEEVRWSEAHAQTVTVDGLATDAVTSVETQWTPGERDLGTYRIEVIADPDERLKETETINNVRFQQIQVSSPGIQPQSGPRDDGLQEDSQAQQEFAGQSPMGPSEDEEEGNQSARVDVRMLDIDHSPGLYVNEEVNLTVVVENRGPDDLQNASLVILVERQQISVTYTDNVPTDIQGEWVTERNESFPLEIPEGGSSEQVMGYTPAQVAAYRVTSWVELDPSTQDRSVDDDERSLTFIVDRREMFQDPELGDSARSFFQNNILNWVQLKLLVPLIAVFFAAGVLNDERRKNTLPYLFTRPVPRWAVPVVRFIVSFVVAGVAMTLGVLAVNAILLGQPGADWEYLYWPLGLTLGGLFVYGAVFTLLGVVTQRPYLWALLYVIGFEGLVYFGRHMLMFEGRPFFQSWTEYLSLNHWFLQVFSGWTDQVLLSPTWWSDAATGAIYAGIGLAIIALVSLYMSGRVIQRRDLEA